MKNLTRTTFVALAIFMSFFLVQSVLAGPRCDEIVAGTIVDINCNDQTCENCIQVNTGGDDVYVCGIPTSILLKNDIRKGDYVYIEARLCDDDYTYKACSITYDGNEITWRGKKD